MTEGPLKPVAELYGHSMTAETARYRLLSAAVDLFYRNGFTTTGLDRVLDAAGVTKTTFYKHFESIDALMVAAVEQRDQWQSAALDRAVRELAGDDPAGQLLAVFDVMDRWFNDSEYRGCMFMIAAAEFPNPHDPVHEAASQFRRKARDHRRELMLSAGAHQAAAESFADCYTALVEGAFILRQTQGRNDAARVVRPMVQQPHCGVSTQRKPNAHACERNR
jgi:AcrR family transcriptional regulator